MNFHTLVLKIRSWLLERLGIPSQEARDGEWWEVDAILVLLLGSALLGIAAFVLG